MFPDPHIQDPLKYFHSWYNKDEISLNTLIEESTDETKSDWELLEESKKKKSINLTSLMTALEMC